MPPDIESVVTAGIRVITILKSFVVFPTEFVALTVKFIAVDVELNTTASTGVPEITPVVSFKLKPVGSALFTNDHVIGVVPVAVSL